MVRRTAHNGVTRWFESTLSDKGDEEGLDYTHYLTGRPGKVAFGSQVYPVHP